MLPPEDAAMPQSDRRGTAVLLYEELREWVLHPARQASHRSPLGQAVLMRSGLGEWMANVLRLQPDCGRPASSSGGSPPALSVSTKAQLAAALATVVLTCMEEVSCEP